MVVLEDRGPLGSGRPLMGRRYFWSAINKVQICGHRATVITMWLIFHWYKFSWVLLAHKNCSPMKNFCIYGNTLVANPTSLLCHTVSNGPSYMYAAIWNQAKCNPRALTNTNSNLQHLNTDKMITWLKLYLWCVDDFLTDWLSHRLKLCMTHIVLETFSDKQVSSRTI